MAYGDRELSKGSKGMDVAELQMRLAEILQHKQMTRNFGTHRCENCHSGT